MKHTLIIEWSNIKTYETRQETIQENISWFEILGYAGEYRPGTTNPSNESEVATSFITKHVNN